MSAFKDFIDEAAVRRLGGLLAAQAPGFDVEALVARALPGLHDLELKARVAQVSEALRATLPPELPLALDLLRRAMPPERPPGPGEHADGWHLWPAAQLVEDHGLPEFEASMAALEAITRVFTAEFAIRPFLLAEPARTLARLHEWTRHESPHVRRLVSEGTRPRLPWGRKLTPFIADPSPTLPLLEALKDDPSEYVRRSVANHLNDIARDHPERALDLAARWSAQAPPERQRLIRHALRGLVKAAHPGALALRGFTGAAELALTDLQAAPTVRAGESLRVGFTLHNRAEVAHRVVLHGALDRPLARGRGERLVVWGELTLPPGASLPLQRTLSMAEVSTRTDRPGRHHLELRANGRALGGLDFELIAR